MGAVGLVEALHTNSSLRSQLNALSRQTRSQLSIVPGKASMAAVKSELASQGQALTKIRNQDATYRNCIPEIQTELDGLSINWNLNVSNPGQSNFAVTNNSQISRDCNRLLYGG